MKTPDDPEARAYLYMGWDKRYGHLPCGQSGCADCERTLDETKALFQRFPLRAYSHPAEASARSLLVAFYIDPLGSGFDPARIP